MGFGYDLLRHSMENLAGEENGIGYILPKTSQNFANRNLNVLAQGKAGDMLVGKNIMGQLAVAVPSLAGAGGGTDVNNNKNHKRQTGGRQGFTQPANIDLYLNGSNCQTNSPGYVYERILNETMGQVGTRCKNSKKSVNTGVRRDVQTSNTQLSNTVTDRHHEPKTTGKIRGEPVKKAGGRSIPDYMQDSKDFTDNSSDDLGVSGKPKAGLRVKFKKEEPVSANGYRQKSYLAIEDNVNGTGGDGR
jgi:hypothetical protein